MTGRGRNGPVFIKTYSKRMRKVDPWFSPDLKKAAFSFSSTPSSDQSIPEATQPKKRMRNAASRPAKSKGMTAIKEKDSDEENYAPPLPYRKKTNSKPAVRTTARKTRTTKKVKRNIKSILSSSENEDDSPVMKKIHPRSAGECADVEQVSDPSLMGRFVTRRKRPLVPVQAQKRTSKRVSVALPRTLNSSDESLPSLSQTKCLVSRKPFCMENQDSDHSGTHKNRKRPRKRAVLGEVSFNDSDDQPLVTKHPLLSSTPSLVCRQQLHLPEPSISEISSLSFDELHQPTTNSTLALKNKAGDRVARVKGMLRPPSRRGEEVMKRREGGEESVVEVTAGDGEREQGMERGPPAQASTGSGSHLESLAEELKERCRTVDVGVMLNRISGRPSSQSIDTERAEEKMTSCCSDSVAATSQSPQTPSVSPSRLSISSTSLPSSPSKVEVQTSANMRSHQSLIDRLKAECLLSCLTVGIPRLDPGADPSVRQGAPRTDTRRGGRSSETENRTVRSRSPIDHSDTGAVVRRLSASFHPRVSPPASAALSEARPPALPKERTGAGTSTGRKVCVSGLNVSRWSKRGDEKRRKKGGDWSSCSGVWSAGAADSACEWLQGTSAVGLAVTPLRMDQMNLSSILANFTPDTLTTHTWGRLKASLSLHKKKTAFPTPQRLAQSHLKTPGSRFAGETSLDLFASPVCTPLSRFTPSRQLRSTLRTPTTPCDDDISDAEKVYQECDQSGPLSFSDCIPPARMKLCSKIGEGTFGEVFSTVNHLHQTVALKIIPVEGSQKVNGEQQKTFAEILHEIIISKELSSLNLKEFNKTDGFIGLNDLHCVRGRYPEELLNAWDEFDCQKGSDNDRPDFFDDKQLFLILEFEFGGNDLENMNGKLSSMAQARSVLHQVTAALAVAEQALCFEHRDLHWGNVLVKNTKQKQNRLVLNGATHLIETRGVHVNIIDYSLSRLEIDGLTVSCDISADEELFMGQGDYQFEIYRLMKKENDNCWSTYHPHSNVLWLHYLADKLLSMSYRTKGQSGQQRTLKSSLRSFHSEILTYTSATDALLRCPFFH